MICFLDRDGIINIDHGHVGTLDRLEIFPEILPILLQLNLIGYKFVMITNQSGLARGLYNYSSFLDVSFYIINYFDRQSISLEINYCPHLPNKMCNCRKPNSGMIERYTISEKDLFIGDQSTDMQAAKNAGIRNRWLINKKSIGPYTNHFQSHKDLLEFLTRF